MLTMTCNFFVWHKDQKAVCHCSAADAAQPFPNLLETTRVVICWLNGLDLKLPTTLHSDPTTNHCNLRGHSVGHPQPCHPRHCICLAMLASPASFHRRPLHNNTNLHRSAIKVPANHQLPQAPSAACTKECIIKFLGGDLDHGDDCPDTAVLQKRLGIALALPALWLAEALAMLEGAS